MDQGNQQRHTFRRAGRLKLKSRIDLLFKKGRSKSSGCLRMVYLFTDEKLEAPVQVLFSVPKSHFKKAVDRNLLKRRMREAYRLNKGELNEDLAGKNKNLLVAFLYIAVEKVTYEKIEGEVKKLLRTIDVS